MYAYSPVWYNICRAQIKIPELLFCKSHQDYSCRKKRKNGKIGGDSKDNRKEKKNPQEE
jgi:hypothetical protein